MSIFSKIAAKRAFRKAKTEAERNGEVLCATLSAEGKPIYFTMPPGATEDEVRDKAFEAVNGRPLSALERTFMAKAREREKGGYL